MQRSIHAVLAGLFAAGALVCLEIFAAPSLQIFGDQVPKIAGFALPSNTVTRYLSVEEVKYRRGLIESLIHTGLYGGGYGPSVGHSVKLEKLIASPPQQYLLIAGHATCGACSELARSMGSAAQVHDVPVYYFVSGDFDESGAHFNSNVTLLATEQKDPLSLTELDTVTFIPSIYFVRDTLVVFEAHGQVLGNSDLHGIIVDILHRYNSYRPDTTTITPASDWDVIDSFALAPEALFTDTDIVLVYDLHCPHTPAVMDTLLRATKSLGESIEVWVTIVNGAEHTPVARAIESAYPWVRAIPSDTIVHPRAVDSALRYSTVVTPEVWFFDEGQFITSIFGRLHSWSSAPGIIDGGVFIDATIALARCINIAGAELSNLETLHCSAMQAPV